MKATQITRHADSINPMIRHLHVRPEGSEDSIVLPISIEKVKGPEAFRQVGSKKVPVEQYEFKIGDTIYKRFAEATAFVIKTCQVELVGDGAKQQYVQKALELVRQ